MSKINATARRVRVERNIYRRPTGVFEVGFKDGAGVQRWRTVDGGITAARALRDELLAQRGRGERVAPNPRLRFGDAAPAVQRRRRARPGRLVHARSQDRRGRQALIASVRSRTPSPRSVRLQARCNHT